MGAPVKFSEISFLILLIHSMRKVDNGEKQQKKIIMLFIVATYVIASRLPERRPTGTLTAQANMGYLLKY